MDNEIVLKVKASYTNKLRTGYPLIAKEALMNIEDLQEELINKRNDR
ncbi:MAG TPA: RlmI/RlmK family 23S rRNA methyltransferase, partial [Bacilli bacterium]|nr:RlmI/RlmK family 23S rRNA methyltransferase [Bacilli bacterium]